MTTGSKDEPKCQCGCDSTATCLCGTVMHYDATDDAYMCSTCLGPERTCRCGARFVEVGGHTTCSFCRRQRHPCGCSACVGPSRAKMQYYAELRQLRLTKGGQQEALSDEIRATVVASGPCVYCGGTSAHADHVWPVSRGGPDSTANLVPTCESCNRGKWSKLLTEWDPERVAYGVQHSPIVAVEYARLTGSVVYNSTS